MPIYALGDHKPKIHDTAYVAPTATIIGNVEIEAGASVWFGAVLRGDNDLLRVGKNSNIQDNSVLHTDPGIALIIGEGVTVGHRVMLHGCVIGDHSLIGIGSTLLNRVAIGASCLVGAHSLVTEGKTFEDKSMVIGSPARKIKTLSDPHIAMLKMSADIYVKNAQRFRDELKAV